MPPAKSAFDTPWFNSQERNFFNSLNKTKIPHLVITAEDDDFDDEIAKKWQSEGFNTAYVPMGDGGADYLRRVRVQGDSFGVGEYYGIVAFGDAAAVILEGHTKPNHPKLVAIVAYYPSTIPAPNTRFPPSIQVLVHLAGGEVGVSKHPEVLGIQGKKKTVRKRVDPGAGYGGCLKLGFLAYTYRPAPGFAECDVDEYDAVAESIAFTRSLRTMQKGFRLDRDANIERIRDDHTSYTVRGDGAQAVKQIDEFGQVMYGPTLTGGVGTQDVQDFYENFFAPLPPSLSVRLLSRTVGTDRVVDEMFVSLKHSQEIPWLLPGIPPTNKTIEVILISIVCVRGGKLESEHVYWDQASVLLQAGLLGRKTVPKAMKERGVTELPIIGAEAARAIKRGSSKLVNDLIPDW